MPVVMVSEVNVGDTVAVSVGCAGVDDAVDEIGTLLVVEQAAAKIDSIASPKNTIEIFLCIIDFLTLLKPATLLGLD